MDNIVRIIKLKLLLSLTMLIIFSWFVVENGVETTAGCLMIFSLFFIIDSIIQLLEKCEK